MELYQRFIDGLRASPNEAALRTVVAEVLAAIDLNQFTYFSPSLSRRPPVFVSTYPTAWTDHYFACGYDAIDPVFRVASERAAPVMWGRDRELQDLTVEQKRLFDEATAFDIRVGLTLPFADPLFGFAALTVVADQHTVAFERYVDRHLPLLQFIATAVHATIRRKAWSSGRVGGVAMTKRELECLRWSAAGKSLGDIGDILGISRRTAVHHLERAKAKLGVRSVCQAVALYAADNG